jgi:hypothetical protein
MARVDSSPTRAILLSPERGIGFNFEYRRHRRNLKERGEAVQIEHRTQAVIYAFKHNLVSIHDLEI